MGEAGGTDQGADPPPSNRVDSTLVTVVAGLATAIQISTVVFDVKPPIPLTTMATAFLVLLLALFVWLFVAISRKGAGVQVYVSLAFVALATAISIAALGHDSQVTGTPLPQPPVDEPARPAAPSSDAPGGTSAPAPSSSTSTAPPVTTTTTTTDRSRAVPAGGGTDCGSEQAYRFCGQIPIFVAIELDTEPPSNFLEYDSVDVVYEDGSIGTLSNAAAAWKDSGAPSREDCDNTIRKSGLAGGYEQKASVGTTMCIRTTKNRIAFLRVVEVEDEGVLVDVIVWE